MQCDGGIIVPQGAHGANTWHLRPPKKGYQRDRGRADHLCGVLPQVFADGEVSSPGFIVVTHSAGQLQEHFMYCHFRSKVMVVQDGLDPLPRCDLCGIHMPAGRLIKHQWTTRCDKNAQMW